MEYRESLCITASLCVCLFVYSMSLFSNWFTVCYLLLLYRPFFHLSPFIVFLAFPSYFSLLFFLLTLSFYICTPAISYFIEAIITSLSLITGENIFRFKKKKKNVEKEKEKKKVISSYTYPCWKLDLLLWLVTQKRESCAVENLKWKGWWL